MIIIAQKFHNERAIYQAEHLGLDVENIQAYNAEDPKSRRAYLTTIREYFARVKMFLDLMTAKNRQKITFKQNKIINSDMMFWHIGRYINEDMGYKQYSAYGSKILATLSQRLTARYGKGYTYSAVTRMMKVARYYSDEETFTTLSQTLTWSHFLELVTVLSSQTEMFGCHC